MRKYFFQEHPLAKHLLYMLGVSIVILILVFLFIRIFARQGAEYELQDFRGLTLEEIEDDNPLGLRYVVIDSIYDPDSDGGVVIQQDPKPGTMIKTHRKIYLTVSTYDPSGVVMPELGNMSVRRRNFSHGFTGAVIGKGTLFRQRRSVYCVRKTSSCNGFQIFKKGAAQLSFSCLGLLNLFYSIITSFAKEVA